MRVRRVPGAWPDASARPGARGCRGAVARGGQPGAPGACPARRLRSHAVGALLQAAARRQLPAGRAHVPGTVNYV